MHTPPPRTPAEALAAMLRWLAFAVDARRAFGLGVPLIGLIIHRFQRINQLFGRIAAGRFFPRSRAAAIGPRATRKTPPLRLPRHLGWLLPLVPDATAARAQLEHMFRDPEMIALMQSAPVPMARALRPLCRMLGTPPPPIIAPPERPKPPRRPRAARPAPPPPRPPLEQPAWMRIGPQRKPWSLTRIRGPRPRG